MRDVVTASRGMVVVVVGGRGTPAVCVVVRRPVKTDDERRLFQQERLVYLQQAHRAHRAVVGAQHELVQTH